VPACARSAVFRAATKVVLLTYVVGRAFPLKATAEDRTKFVPVRVTFVVDEPTMAVGGLTADSVGALGASTLNGRAGVVLPAEVTVTWALPMEERSAAVTEKFNWLELRKLVGRVEPFHCTDAVGPKFVPLTATVVVPLPAAACDGDSDTMVGGVAGVGVGELEPPPPHALINNVAIDKKTRTVRFEKQYIRSSSACAVGEG
jgi:hypothetical protein